MLHVACFAVHVATAPHRICCPHSRGGRWARRSAQQTRNVPLQPVRPPLPPSELAWFVCHSVPQCYYRHRCHAIPSTYDALLSRPALLHAPPRSLARRAVLPVVHPLCCTGGVALLLQRHPLPLKSLVAYAGSAVGRRRADTEAAWLRGQRNDGRQDERDREAGVAGGRGAVRAIVRCDNSTLVADMRAVGLGRSIALR